LKYFLDLGDSLKVIWTGKIVDGEPDYVLHFDENDTNKILELKSLGKDYIEYLAPIIEEAMRSFHVKKASLDIQHWLKKPEKPGQLWKCLGCGAEFRTKKGAVYHCDVYNLEFDPRAR
jgi:hypothetical protein